MKSNRTTPKVEPWQIPWHRDECDCDERCKECGKKKKKYEYWPYRPYHDPFYPEPIRYTFTITTRNTEWLNAHTRYIRKNRRK